MYKTIILSVALTSASCMQGVTLGQNLLNNSPIAYLLDLDKFINNATVTQQIGNILYSKNYLGSVTVHATMSGSNNQRPTVAAGGYTLSEGQWIWVPTSLGSTDGTWYWILRTLSYYLSIFISIG